jgi:UTP--glucose-1-phosphate uridylyltransferase
MLPATKAVPKEMLPILNKPCIQYIVEEAVYAGIEEILIITGRTKKAIEDHFDRSPELELHLEQNQKSLMLTEVKAISDYVRRHRSVSATRFFVRSLSLETNRSQFCLAMILSSQMCPF